jgi:hypothetical protein
MGYKSKSIIMLSLPLILFLLIFLFDPLAIFHQFGYKTHWFGLGLRVHAASAINSGKYDSFILGTSMLENTSARELEKLFSGSRFANISISAGNFYEQSILLESIFKDKHVKNIIFSLDDVYLKRVEARPSTPPESFAYLYNTNRLDDIQVYFTWPGIIKGLTHFFFKELLLKEKVHDRYIDFNRPNAWMYDDGHMCRFGGLEKWFAAENNDQIIRALRTIFQTSSEIASGKTDFMTPSEESQEISRAIAYCKKYVIRHVKENPSVRFYLLFPPYSRIHFASWHQYFLTNARIHEAVVRYFANMTKELDNLSVYGFEDQVFLDQIEFYKDTGHFHPEINQKINLCLKNDECRLTTDNVEQYLMNARKAALDFDLIELGRKIDIYLNEQVK